jgi:hypothetical protein
MTWLSANNSVDGCWFFESLLLVMSCFCHLVIISSKYMLNSVGESGQSWRTPLLISTGFESLLYNTHKRQTSKLPVEFKPTIPASKQRPMP